MQLSRSLHCPFASIFIRQKCNIQEAVMGFDLKLGDCIELIKKVPDGSVDAIITDPPYFIGITHNSQKGVFKDLAICKPFFAELFEQFKRVLKPTGSVYFFSDFRGYSFFHPLMQEFLPVKNMLVWDKMSGWGNYYSFAHELIIYAVDKPHRNGKGFGLSVIRIPGFAAGAKKRDGEKVHPTQKPTELIEKLITDSTDEGDTVLDVFAGSGTTGVACARLNRSFIGFEIDEKYYEIAKKRIEDEYERVAKDRENTVL